MTSKKFYKPDKFFISRQKWDKHHPDKDRFPDWTIDLPTSLHDVINAFQREPLYDESLTVLRGFIDSLEYEYLNRRRILDEKDAEEEDEFT